MYQLLFGIQILELYEAAKAVRSSTTDYQSNPYVALTQIFEPTRFVFASSPAFAIKLALVI